MSFLEDLNPAQREAVKTVDGPVMIVAGAGSGKTRVLTYRVAYLISLGIPAYRILALTFTNKAANEMKSRIVKLVGQYSVDVWMGTFHSMFARMLRTECERLGFNKNFTIYDTDDSLSLIRHIQQTLGISPQQFNPHAVRARISAVKNRCISSAEFARQASDVFEEKTARVYAEYQKRLKQLNAVDFDDLLLKPIELFQKNKNVLDKYQDRFRYILVDEYQDTNRAQYIILKLLAEKHRNVCVVGDDAQSIYAFRGADIRNILEFEQEFPNCKVFRLEQNYRSTKTILAAADLVIKNNIDQLHKNLWTENPQGESVTLLICGDDKDEGQQIVYHLQKEIMKKKLDLNDFAVLYRTNAQSRSLEEAFRRSGIPYVIVGGVEFYQRKEIKDILAYLRLIVNPQDDQSLLRIINVPARGIGQIMLERLQAFAAKHTYSLWEALERISNIKDLSLKAQKNLQEFHDILRKYMRLRSEMSANELSRVLVDELGILRELKEEGTPEALIRRENIQELFSAISEYVADHLGAHLEDFLQEVSLISNIDKWDDTRNVVTLMTAHSAKGLEFPVVFIVGLEEGLFPFYSSVVDQKELEEERRLFYVGMTRTKRKLFLSYAHTRYRFGNITYQMPSRFIEEIDQNLLEIEQRACTVSPFRSSTHFDVSTFEVEEEHHRIDARQGKVRSRRKTFGDSVYFSGEHPDYESESQVTDQLRVGAKVEHDVFGRGKVVELSGHGEFAKAVVDFYGVGRKNLLLKYAHLRIV